MSDQHDDSHDEREKRSFPWLIVFLAGPPALYCLGLLLIQFLGGAGLVSDETLNTFSPVYLPVVSYVESGNPGSEWIGVMLLWAYEAGEVFR